MQCRSLNERVCMTSKGLNQHEKICVYTLPRCQRRLLTRKAYNVDSERSSDWARDAASTLYTISSLNYSTSHVDRTCMYVVVHTHTHTQS